ncbi:MAG: PaaI family thioesterase [Rhodothermales bacterium]
MPIHEQQTKTNILRFAAQFPFFNLIGLKVLDIEPGWSKTRVTWRDDLAQPFGVMHGGVIASLIDTGIAHALLLTEAFDRLRREKGALVSIDLRVKYFRPVSEGSLICESTIPRMGRQIIHAESIVTNDGGKEVARGDSIYMIVPGNQLQKRRNAGGNTDS